MQNIRWSQYQAALRLEVGGDIPDGLCGWITTMSRSAYQSSLAQAEDRLVIVDIRKLCAKLLGLEAPAWVPDCAIDCKKLSGKSPSLKGARPSNLHDYVGQKVAYRKSCASYFVSTTISSLPCQETTVHWAKPLDDGCLGYLLSSPSKDSMDCCTKVYII